MNEFDDPSAVLGIEQFGDFLGEMLFTGKVTPKFTFIDNQSQSAYVLDHPMYGQLDSRQVNGPGAAALSVLIEVFEWTIEMQEEFQCKRYIYDEAMRKYQRQSVVAKLRKSAVKKPDDSELQSLVETIEELHDVIRQLSSLVFFVKDGIIDPEVFDEAIKRLGVEDLIASPIDNIVIDDALTGVEPALV